MDTDRALLSLGVSLALGLLVGLQRERADSAIAGFRTFALIALLGTVCALLSGTLGVWVMPAGLLGVAAATAVGNRLRPPAFDAQAPGITTEVAALLMFAVGALLWIAPLHVGVIVGVTCALLLHLKDRMHAFAGKLSSTDMHAFMQFCAVTFVVLPLLPDRSFGPLGVLNPRHIWWMVVLVVGISLLGYVTLKLVGARAGTVLAGLIGGVVSSTAATASSARRVASSPEAVPAAALAVMLAQCVLIVRVMVEIAITTPLTRWVIMPPLAIILALAVLLTIFAFSRAKRASSELPHPTNPSELRGALWFGALYAGVLMAAAAAQHWLGTTGIYAVAALGGLTDMDAITLSSARLAQQGDIEAPTAARAVLLGLTSNTIFKLALVYTIAGRTMLVSLLPLLGLLIVAAGVLIAL